jgi:hypothetical protein
MPPRQVGWVLFLGLLSFGRPSHCGVCACACLAGRTDALQPAGYTHARTWAPRGTRAAGLGPNPGTQGRRPYALFLSLSESLALSFSSALGTSYVQRPVPGTHSRSLPSGPLHS